MSDTRLPVFVYGTLRRDCGNYLHFLDGRTTSEQIASLPGAVMKTNGGFPYVYLSEGPSTVIGELMDIDEDRYEATVRGLDSLEGFHGEGSKFNHYDRVEVDVVTESGDTIKAHTYIASAATIRRIANLPLVEDGNWHTARTTRGLRYSY